VLSEFAQDEGPLVEAVVERCVQAVLCWSREGVEQAMNRYNGPLELPEQDSAAQ